MQRLKKTEKAAENIYENMPDQKLFLMIRDDLLHSRTCIFQPNSITVPKGLHAIPLQTARGAVNV